MNIIYVNIIKKGELNMFNTKKLFPTLLISTGLILGLSATSAHSHLKSVTQKIGKGSVDWTYGTIKVTGIGAPPAKGTAGQKRLMAQQAARADGFRKLAEIVYGVHVTSETIVKNFVTESDVIKTEVSGVIKGAQSIKTRYLSDSSVEVDMAMPVYGKDSLAKALDFGEFVEKESGKELKVQGNKFNYKYKVALIPFLSDIPMGPYKVSAVDPTTGLIINASGLGVEPAMCPFIIGGAKRVYPSNKIELDPDAIVKEGVSHYVTDIEEAKKDLQRIGANPLVIDAKAVKPGSDLILATESISKIVDENKKFNFLSQLKVTIVID